MGESYGARVTAVVSPRSSELMNNASSPATVAADAHELELFRRAQQGDFAAFEVLVDRFQPRVYGLARRIVGQAEDAEDVTQQTFLSVIEHLNQFRGESAVATWVLRIATNHALKVLRKRRGLPTVPLESVADPDDSSAPLPHPDYIAQWRDNPEDLAQRAEVRQLVEQALADLDDKYRTVFVLRDIEGLTVKETAEVLGLGESNIKVRLLRARLQLRERLTRALGDEATRMFPTHAHE
jgi:RNA polymerase sigma-70 factor (ECF subfamily)